MKLLYNIPEKVDTLIKIYQAQNNLKNKSAAINSIVLKLLDKKK